MASYPSDRAFTDQIHQRLALPLIYEPLGWLPVQLLPDHARELDINAGIDYIFETPEERMVTVQERFREAKYKSYNDFTIRYRRDENRDAARHQSEYYKMQADYFVYGITNGSKEQAGSITAFEKFAVIDLAGIYQRIDDGRILIRNNGQHYCMIKDNRLICPIKHNHDGSSSFFPVDIVLLAGLWPELIIRQQGFF